MKVNFIKEERARFHFSRPSWPATTFLFPQPTRQRFLPASDWTFEPLIHWGLTYNTRQNISTGSSLASDRMSKNDKLRALPTNAALPPIMESYKRKQNGALPEDSTSGLTKSQRKLLWERQQWSNSKQKKNISISSRQRLTRSWRITIRQSRISEKSNSNYNPTLLSLC